MKRALDFSLALLGLLITSPILVPLMIAIWAQDFGSPLFKARRMARNGCTFRMVKLRSMVKDAPMIGGSSTAVTDRRITPVGCFFRNFKLDELPQLWNVLKGEMSLVGPRPQVEADARDYTAEENRMLTIRPGITDLASIVFADEGDILAGSEDADLLYNQVRGRAGWRRSTPIGTVLGRIFESCF